MSERMYTEDEVSEVRQAAEEAGFIEGSEGIKALRHNHGVGALSRLVAKAVRNAHESAAEICDAKAVYANRSRHGKDEFMQGLLSELENVLRDTAMSIRALDADGLQSEVEDAPNPQVQVSGPQCKKCGAFTTYARVKSHGL